MEIINLYEIMLMVAGGHIRRWFRVLPTVGMLRINIVNQFLRIAVSFLVKWSGLCLYIGGASRKSRIGPLNKVLTDSHIYDTIFLDKAAVRLLPDGFEV